MALLYLSPLIALMFDLKINAMRSPGQFLGRQCQVLESNTGQRPGN
jgi:hypothetical protein